MKGGPGFLLSWAAFLFLDFLDLIVDKRTFNLYSLCMPIKDKNKYNAYMRDYLKDKYEDRRQYVLDTLGGKCACGSEENLNATPGADADASFNLSRKLNNAPWDKIVSELKFYSLMCASCISKRTKGVEHGGGISGVRNCKCELCKARKAEYQKAYMAERRKAAKGKV